MALMLGRLHAALIAANVPPDTAREAAEEVAGFENRLAGLDTKMAVLTWMVGAVLVLEIGIIIRLLTVSP